jgi:hypothetical protein
LIEEVLNHVLRSACALVGRIDAEYIYNTMRILVVYCIGWACQDFRKTFKWAPPGGMALERWAPISINRLRSRERPDYLRGAEPLSFKIINNLVDNVPISLFEGPDCCINVALAVKFHEHLLLARSGLRVWEKPER